MASRVRIGTSGWHYPHWAGVAYPVNSNPAQWLQLYARQLDTVEVNRSFYSLPTARAVRDWRSAVPKNFRFSLKGSRYITHMKKLLEPEQSLRPFAETAGEFGPQLGPVLFQLPPRWGVNAGRLRDFLQALPRRWRCAFEFRDPSWHRDDIYGLLAEHDAAFCIFEIGGFASPLVATADWVYARLHGPGEAYRGRYGGRALSQWWKRLCRLPGAKEWWIYFDNDEAGYAFNDALELKRLTG